MGLRFFRPDLSPAHQFADEGMVCGKRLELALAEPVGAAVSDVGDPDPLIAE